MSRFIVLAALSLATTPAFAQEASYNLRPISLSSGAERRAVESDLRRLPRGVVAMPPAVDGGLFVATVESGIYPVTSSREVTAALSEILPALGVTVDVSELAVVQDGERRPAPDLGTLTAEGELLADEWVAAAERRVGPLSDDTLDMLYEEGRALYDAAATPVQVWRFQQMVGEARAESRTIIVQVDETGIRRITGALFNDTATSNEVKISAEEAVRYAERHAEEVRGSVPDAPELVAITDGTDLRYAWRALVETVDGEYALDIDAATGEVLQVDPQFYSFSEAEGAVARPGVPTTPDVLAFGVDATGGCDHTLDHTGVVTLSNSGADGFTGDVKACIVGNIVDFDVAPINDTTNVMLANGANYNAQFAHVNAYAWVYETLDWAESRGSVALPAWEVVVNDTNVCGFGLDNACGKAGRVVFGIGSETLGTGSVLLNTALDAGVVVHEVGHGINNLQYASGGGVQSGSNGEGLSDYWAMTVLNTDIVGVVTANTTADVQSSWLPRQADAADVFPEHMAMNNTGVHANGQIIARALWQSRTEMDGRSPIGPMANDEYLMAALPGSGAGQSKTITELDVHNAFQGVLVSMLLEAGDGYPASDILVGFAQAGLLVTEREAVIDISDDLLEPNQAPPTFQVWTGRDFGFTGTASNSTTYFGNRYEIEVANDAAFTQNVVSSGVQSNVAVSNGVATATWTLPQASWDVLKDGSAVYFRVSSWTAGQEYETLRDSEHWYGQWVEIAPSRAIVNHTNQGSACNTAPAGAAFSTALVAGLAALLRRRRE